MAADYLVIGKFPNGDIAAEVITTLKGEGHDKNMTSFSPIPHHGMEDALYEGRTRSPVRMCTLIGGLTGCLFAFLFTTWMSVDYPIRVSAKPLISIPSFIVIAFECMILFGAISTLAGMFHFSRIPMPFLNPAARAEFTEGTFGVVVRVPKGDKEEMKKHLESLGADDVEEQYVR